MESSHRVTFQDMDVRSANGENIFNGPFECAYIKKHKLYPIEESMENILSVPIQDPIGFTTEVDIFYARLRSTCKKSDRFYYGLLVYFQFVTPFVCFHWMSCGSGYDGFC